ncbi:flagellar motor switch protein FliM [Caldicellulosiruptor hydrothermalis 108]|uniref:Flagellar motor switch protein FliM n=1 Tax=Caldicellulosiruptor hydrothermalis (strain DSM 18901 / VKM B-2411 / 108) TaxID=632292 RepID=E4QCW7_CALH1|nr:flagellar motor switch protein FliM [Caldicellulosiruptor hydrothermalis]ADQ06336.1 flagellar motor switch protein FliM [Caldicellulosiruptor hydrothermalis 108]
MGDILSQSEIDELLRSLTSGELSIEEIQKPKQEKNIRVYDFKRPSKFAKDHLRTLQMIFENYARIVTTFLSGYLRTVVQMDVLSVEQLTYYEFSNSLSNPVVMGIVNFSPLKGSIVFEMAPEIAFAMIDRVLGGFGKGIDKVRTFTEIELVLIERLLQQLINYFQEAWENIVDLRPRLEKIETNPQFTQIVSPNETVALVTIAMKVGEVEGMANICLPHMVIEPIMPRLSTKFWFSTSAKETSEETKEYLQKKIERTRVTVKAVLGRTQITVREFLELQVGDVLRLDRRKNQEIEVFVGNKLKFYGVPGRKEGRIAVKITRVEEGEDFR